MVWVRSYEVTPHTTAVAVNTGIGFIVTSYCCLKTFANTISSRAKSFPLAIVLLLTSEIVALVTPGPEVQVVLKYCQVPSGEAAERLIEPTVPPLIEN